MAKPGRKAKPAALKQLQGNPGGRPLTKNEPKPLKGAPTPPTWLDAEGKAEWARVVPELDRIGLLTKVDRQVLATLCQTWADYVEALAIIRREGTVSVSEKGGAYQHPAVGQKNAALKLLMGLWSRLGLTPSDRANMNFAEPNEPSKLKLLMFGEHAKGK